MRAIILAAGRGSRMKGMTENQPKCFAELHGKRLIDWQIGALTDAGVGDISIVRGYLAEAFEYPCRYFENERWQETNMLRSLCAARDAMMADACIVSYSDIVYSHNSIRRILQSTDDIAITYDPNWLKLWSMRFTDPLSDAETFRLDAAGYLIEIGGKAESVDEIKGQYMGLLRFSPAGWAAVEQFLGQLPSLEVDTMDMTNLLRRLIASGVKIRGIPIDEPWYEVDNEFDLAKYNSIPRGQLFGEL